MSTWVLDASVIAKWFLRDDPEEEDVPKAMSVLDGIRRDTFVVLQPPHWLAEAAAVAARLRPAEAERIVQLLDAMELPVKAEPEVYTRAVRLARELDHHLFDTLYHAVALNHREATLLTADRRYYSKARGSGRIALLSDWAGS